MAEGTRLATESTDFSELYTTESDRLEVKDVAFNLTKDDKLSLVRPEALSMQDRKSVNMNVMPTTTTLPYPVQVTDTAEANNPYLFNGDDNIIIHRDEVDHFLKIKQEQMDTVRDEIEKLERMQNDFERERKKAYREMEDARKLYSGRRELELARQQAELTKGLEVKVGKLTKDNEALLSKLRYAESAHRSEMEDVKREVQEMKKNQHEQVQEEVQRESQRIEKKIRQEMMDMMKEMQMNQHANPGVISPLHQVINISYSGDAANRPPVVQQKDATTTGLPEPKLDMSDDVDSAVYSDMSSINSTTTATGQGHFRRSPTKVEIEEKRRLENVYYSNSCDVM